MPGTFNGLKWVPEVVNPVLDDDALYGCNDADDLLYEIDKDTKVVLKSVASPSSQPYDIGGVKNRLYHCDLNIDNIYELDIDTLLPINTVSSPSVFPSGVGGISNPTDRLYHSDFNTDLIYELDLNTLLPLSNAASPTGNLYGTGGIGSRLYHLSGSPDTRYELDPDTKLQINSASAGDLSNDRGIGGIINRLYQGATGNLAELDPDTILVISTNSGTTSNGAGGIKRTLTVTKLIIQKATFKGNTFNLNEIFLDTKPQ